MLQEHAAVAKQESASKSRVRTRILIHFGRLVELVQIFANGGFNDW